MSASTTSNSVTVQVQANVPDGLYELWVGYNSPFGFKGYDYQVDSVNGSGGFDGNGSSWGVDRAGLFSLTGATNTLAVNRGWGYYNVDYFELRPFTPPALAADYHCTGRRTGRPPHADAVELSQERVRAQNALRVCSTTAATILPFRSRTISPNRAAWSRRFAAAT